MRRPWPFLLALLGGCAALRSLVPESYPYQVAPGAVRIAGPEARAVGVAFNDFISHQIAETAELMAWEPDAGGFTPEEVEQKKPFWDCLEDPKGYDVWYRLDDGGTKYMVEIYTKPEVCFGSGNMLFGGGSSYEIDAKSFAILKREIGCE